MAGLPCSRSSHLWRHMWHSS